MTEYKFIESDADLEHACELLSESGIVGVDTEFERQTTFYPRTGLVQIGDDRNFFLVDPFTIRNWKPLVNLFTDVNTVKVMHSCSEDLEVFRHQLKVIPEPIFDTQVAAACCGYDLQLGYQKLVAELLNIHVEKGETRSNWMRRPLTAAQLKYAVDDIVYLPRLYSLLKERLQELDRQDLCEEDCQRMVEQAGKPLDTGSYYLQVKNAWVLDAEQIAVLKAMCAWREEEIRSLNIPRTFFIPDNALWSIAKFLPQNLKELMQVRGIDKKWMDQYGGVMLDIVFDTLEVAWSNPVAVVRKPLGREAKEMFDDIKAVIRKVAGQQDLEPSVVCRKKTAEKLVDHLLFNDGEYPPELLGWRREVIAPALEETIGRYKHLAGNEGK